MAIEDPACTPGKFPAELKHVGIKVDKPNPVIAKPIVAIAISKELLF